jgi:hypothetical protein
MKWQYKVATFSLRRSDWQRENLIPELERSLDELGSEGWELLLFHTHEVIVLGTTKSLLCSNALPIESDFG